MSLKHISHGKLTGGQAEIMENGGYDISVDLSYLFDFDPDYQKFEIIIYTAKMWLK